MNLNKEITGIANNFKSLMIDGKYELMELDATSHKGFVFYTIIIAGKHTFTLVKYAGLVKVSNGFFENYIKLDEKETEQFLKNIYSTQRPYLNELRKNTISKIEELNKELSQIG